MELISVIVPMYNTEKYVGECIESLTKQTYENIEIIVIDDGSIDNSLEICKDYANIDNRIKIIEFKENKGLSEARNAGLDIAKGEYIAFVDSDDYVTEKYLEELYNAIIEFDVDLAQCDFYKMDTHDEIIGTYKEHKEGEIITHVFSGREMIKNLYNEHTLPTTMVWTKLYKREFLYKFVDYCREKNDKGYIRFPKDMIFEDEAFCYKIYDQIKKAVIFDKRLYCYRYVEDSITNQPFSYKKLDELKHLEERLRIFKQKKDMDLYYLTARRYYYELVSALNKCKKYIPSSYKAQRKLKKKIVYTLKTLMRVGRFEDKSFIVTKLIQMKCIYLRLVTVCKKRQKKLKKIKSN